MNSDVSIADIVVHLHPHLSDSDKANVERDLRAHEGVVSVHFSAEDHPNALIVAYDPQTISSENILAGIRKWDKDAVMASL